MQGAGCFLSRRYTSRWWNHEKSIAIASATTAEDAASIATISKNTTRFIIYPPGRPAGAQFGRDTPDKTTFSLVYYQINSNIVNQSMKVDVTGSYFGPVGGIREPLESRCS
jgi:hypothetical protein